MKTLMKKKRNYDRVELYDPEMVYVSNGACPQINQGNCNGSNTSSGGGFLKGIATGLGNLMNLARGCKK